MTGTSSPDTPCPCTLLFLIAFLTLRASLLFKARCLSSGRQIWIFLWCSGARDPQDPPTVHHSIVSCAKVRATMHFPP